MTWKQYSKRTQNTQKKHPYISWAFFIKSNLTLKQRDKIRDTVARREGTSKSLFVNFIWDKEIHDKTTSQENIFPSNFLRRDAP